MKRFLSISLAMMYLLLTAGFTINIHYCLGEIQSVTPFVKADSCCCGTDEMPVDCCGDEQMIFQFSPDDQLIKSDYSIFKAPLLEPIEIASVRCIENEDHQKVILKFCKSPPPDKIPIWLKNSNFIFYG
jgi:hypothetical protein